MEIERRKAELLHLIKRPIEGNFIGLGQSEIEKNFFSRESVASDLAFVAEKKAEYQGLYASGEKLEAIFGTFADYSKWFGEGKIARTSHYDDYYGTDYVVEFVDQNNERLVLAVDLTSSSKRQELARKFYRNRGNILKGGTNIKYFESPSDGSKSYYWGAIPVIIGVDNHHVDQIIKIESILGNKKQKESFLLFHPIQLILLEEIKEQLNYYLSLNLTDETKAKVRDLSRIINDQTKQNRKTLDQIDCANYKNDNTYRTINRLISYQKNIRKRL